MLIHLLFGAAGGSVLGAYLWPKIKALFTTVEADVKKL